MSFTQFWIILRARYKLVLLALVITVATVLTVSLLLPKTYQATTTLVLNYKGTDPLTGLALPGQMMAGFLATQVDIIDSKNVALKVVDALKLDQLAAAKRQFDEATQGQGEIRDWLAKRLLRGLDVTPARDSSVLDVTYKSTDPNSPPTSPTRLLRNTRHLLCSSKWRRYNRRQTFSTSRSKPCKTIWKPPKTDCPSISRKKAS